MAIEQLDPANRPLDLPRAGEIERLVRARGSLFLVTDRHGDVTPAGARELGLFHDDTRHLSHYELRVRGGLPPVRLSAETTHPAYNQVDLMLSGEQDGDLDDPKNYLHIRRRQLLDGGLVEEIVLTNFLQRTMTIELVLAYGADFADMFEVRGARRARRGTFEPPRFLGSSVVLAYAGIDGAKYTTSIAFAPTPSELTADQAVYELTLPVDRSMTLEVRVFPARDGAVHGVVAMPFARRVSVAEREAETFLEGSARWTSDHASLQGALDRSASDLFALRVKVGDQHIVGAGIPWFCAPFGRDALITAYEALSLNPDLAIESLRTLAAYQGTKYDDTSEEEPGKIFHELRFGEMVRAKEIPHSPYYGSIDATPLFVVLAEAAYRFTGDVGLLQELRAPVLAALAWIDARSEDATRLVAYQRKTPAGLENQGWKDSRAGVSFPDGRRAETPIALSEVQGYCIDAYRRGALLFSALGERERAREYEARSEKMRELFEHAFWLPGVNRYAYAVDGRKRVLPTIVSNTGHLLWSRAVPQDRAEATARTLLASNMFNGYGIRTLASEQPVYNPLSYHNGTVWPHDNALIAKGLANYGLGLEAARVFEGLLAAMEFFRDRRIPELYCGIGRRAGPVVHYPVAGSPQAWSAASPFLLLRAMLGLHADAPRGRLAIRNPILPAALRRVEVRGLRVGNATVRARFRRVGAKCHVDMVDVTGGPLKVEIEIG